MDSIVCIAYLNTLFFQSRIVWKATWILGYFVGRLIYHLTNSSGVNNSNGVDLDDLEFFVLNEADRLCKWKVQLLGLFCWLIDRCIFVRVC